jgi:hypothetical protein
VAIRSRKGAIAGTGLVVGYCDCARGGARSDAAVVVRMYGATAFILLLARGRRFNEFHIGSDIAALARRVSPKDRTQSSRAARAMTPIAPAASHLRPMSEFDASQPAILHDRSTGDIEAWTGEDAADFRHNSIARPDGTIEWRAFVFDGWGEVLGG